MAKLATTYQASVIDGISGLTELIISKSRSTNSGRPLEVHPRSDSNYASIQTLAKALDLLCEEAKCFYKEDH